jgi:uncharacterized repeat protein (TIGR03806 family)
MKWKLILAFALTIPGIAAIKKADPPLPSRLSAYHLDAGFTKYELATPLFTDYAEKERLIKLPAATTLTPAGDGLPIFPDGAILVKTFFYWRDKRDTTKGKQLIETRVLLKTSGAWQAGTYVWNEEQTEAFLTNAGQKIAINWIDETGTEKNIRYQVPTTSQCGVCHQSTNAITPIGFKVRNLNFPVARTGQMINQLTWLAQKGIFPAINPSAYAALPAWNDSTQTMEKRARAYLDVNCAHCHNEKGYCKSSDFHPAFENTLPETKIEERKKRILRFLRSGRMPLLDTTVVHQEGLQLIANYLNKK